MRRERKVVWVYPSKDQKRCPIQLVEKYMSLCLPSGKCNNFYLQLLQRPNPKRWYSNQVVGQNSISKVVKQMMCDANIEGFFTNHSLRRTGGTRLFRGGVDHKLVKETAGHRSDSVDAYQITSDEQRDKISEIIRNEPVACVSKSSDTDVVDEGVKSEEKVGAKVNICKCKGSNANIGNIINELVEGVKGKGKTIIKFQIEMKHE